MLRIPSNPTNPQALLIASSEQPVSASALTSVLHGEVVDGPGSKPSVGTKPSRQHRDASGRRCAAPVRVGGIADIGKPDPNAKALYMRYHHGKLMEVARGTPIEVDYADYSGLGKPLAPDLQAGAEGENEENESKEESEPEAATDDQEKGKGEEGAEAFVYHRVSPADTLEGILLRYRVKLHQLKRWNAFPGSAFACLSELRVPKSVLPPDFVPQGAETADEKVVRLARSSGGPLSVAEARFYLDEAGGDYDAALAAIRADDEWEEETVAQGTRSALAPSAPSAPVAPPMPAAIAGAALGAAVGARVGLTAGTAVGTKVGATVSAAIGAE